VSKIFLPKLSKSDNWFLSYGRKCRGCFFETQCRKEFDQYDVPGIKRSCTMYYCLIRCNSSLLKAAAKLDGSNIVPQTPRQRFVHSERF